MLVSSARRENIAMSTTTMSLDVMIAHMVDIARHWVVGSSIVVTNAMWDATIEKQAQTLNLIAFSVPLADSQMNQA